MLTRMAMKSESRGESPAEYCAEHEHETDARWPAICKTPLGFADVFDARQPIASEPQRGSPSAQPRGSNHRFPIPKGHNKSAQSNALGKG